MQSRGPRRQTSGVVVVVRFVVQYVRSTYMYMYYRDTRRRGTRRFRPLARGRVGFASVRLAAKVEYIQFNPGFEANPSSDGRLRPSADRLALTSRVR